MSNEQFPWQQLLFDVFCYLLINKVVNNTLQQRKSVWLMCTALLLEQLLTESTWLTAKKNTVSRSLQNSRGNPIQEHPGPVRAALVFVA